MCDHDLIKIGKYAKIWDVLVRNDGVKEEGGEFCVGNVNGTYVPEKWILKKIFSREGQKDIFGDYFYSVILYNQESDQYIVAYQYRIAFTGTDYGAMDKVKQDFLVTNGQIAVGLKFNQLSVAEDVFLEALSSNFANGDYSKITLVGQSLGGGLAEYLATKYADKNVAAYIYNSLGIKNIAENEGIYDNTKSYDNIKCYMSIIDMTGNMAPHCSRTINYVKKPKEYLNGNDTNPPFLKDELNTARKFIDNFSKVISITELSSDQKSFNIDLSEIGLDPDSVNQKLKEHQTL